ncbi:glutathione S-transferase [Dactylosporangium sp. AC04546]|uniref:glutathione S-transferase C-terminal domain-containing protein n=1 Tax=Dactylosporangium sp. AC04546 TaxID=2862460 RepID=UPI001EDD5DE3|nr:glutathione S-transferase C-terminal domain-containing protein [Dactylosporangium sp. AC04546]WVK86242.1 glutathione S-transferase [Dactylosporangium sp. AC04546]
MSRLPRSSRLASPVDTTTHGEYRVVRDPGDPRPLYRFAGRITEAEAGRYHVYAGWFCPWAQRITITIELAGLRDVVGVSYVDNARDGRGWAFRERYGPDPVNGFTLLRQAYEATEPGFDGHVSVPTLWDRATGRVLSNEYKTLGIDLATRFRSIAEPVIDTYPEALREEIEALDEWLGPAVNRGGDVDAAFAALDERLSTRRYLTGPSITQADVRLWVTLARYGAGLADHPHLWAYARDLYTVPAFRDTTDFSTFQTPNVLDWTAPAERPEGVTA